MKQKFNVTGMTCSACSAHVEKAVRQVEGVDSVSVNLLGNSMLVEYGGKTGPEQIIQAVTDAGYGASLPGPAGKAAPAARPADALEEELIGRLGQARQGKRLFRGVELVRRLRSAARLNVNPGQLAGWLCGYDLVVNTVPALVLGEAELADLKPDCLVLDLASKPGGVDLEAAGRLGRTVIWALSLPGKVAPVTAGSAIKNTIYHMLHELGA